MTCLELLHSGHFSLTTQPGGFLVIHARKKDVARRVEVVSACGYTMLRKFLVPKKAWWDGYYRPLQLRIDRLRVRHQGDARTLSLLTGLQEEVEEFKSNPEHSGSVFYVCQKSGSDVYEEL